MDRAEPLRGRRVAVTGASRGIGRATAALLATLGASVAAGARALGELDALAGERRGVRAYRLDVRDEASVAAFATAVERDLGGVDAVVHVAGVGAFGPVASTSLADWEEVFAVNARGTFLVARAFTPALTASRGQFVAVTSDVSARTFAGGALYVASKHAQRAFVRALQQELHAANVRVTEVRPGVVTTHFAGATPGDPSEHALSADDVAEVIAFALTRPARLRFDELHFHPSGQSPDF